MVAQISFEAGNAILDWGGAMAAFEDGHKRPPAQIKDILMQAEGNALLNRAAWIEGMGIAIKTGTIFPGNVDQGLPSINGMVTVFSPQTGEIEALIDFHLVTKWKTIGDSLLAAKRLAPEGASNVLIVGAGTVGAGAIEAFAWAYPEAQIRLWNRTQDRAEALAERFSGVEVVTDLAAACGEAQIIVSGAMVTEPLIQGEWLSPGTHVNLIGAYMPHMREVDDVALTRADAIYVDSYHTTLEDIGEIAIPLETGVLKRADILADYYDLDRFQRGGADEITIFKNGGGAHLDLMISRWIVDRWTA